MSAAEKAAPVSPAEAKTLFDALVHTSVLIVAVSGGPDSTALLVLATRWRAALKRGPELLAVTVDHGLRPEAAREARAVKRLASRLGIRHRTLRWTGPKPATGLQEAARMVRYRLLAAAARGAGASHILTAHTLDDQAETVLIRMARGSGLTGLGAMVRIAPLPASGERQEAGASGEREVLLMRPLLDLPKARLVATLAAVGISFAADPSNRDPRFTRVRMRRLLPALAQEGLDARRLALLARRLRRAEETIEIAVGAAAEAVAEAGLGTGGPVVLSAEKFSRLPGEVALRLLGRAIAACGDEGPVQLGKLEALYDEFAGAKSRKAGRLRRTLAGALVTLMGGRLTVERAPARTAAKRARSATLTTRKYGRADRPKAR